MQLTPDGFTAAQTLRVNVNVWCAEATCGQIADGVNLLLFVPTDARAITLDAGPCDGGYLQDPSQQLLELLGLRVTDIDMLKTLVIDNTVRCSALDELDEMFLTACNNCSVCQVSSALQVGW